MVETTKEEKVVGVCISNILSQSSHIARTVERTNSSMNDEVNICK